VISDFARPKILMLTHRVLASQQGYTNLVDAFTNLEGLSALEDVHLEYFVRTLEPVCVAYAKQRCAAMFEHLDAKAPIIRGAGDKQAWNIAMERLLATRAHGTVQDVLVLLRETGRPQLPDRLEQREADMDAGIDAPSTSRFVAKLPRLKTVPYDEVARFAIFHSKTSPFATKHGVKGAEFQDVLVVISRGWNNYDFNAMLEWAAREQQLVDGDRARPQPNRNLFYVACSRARVRLTVLFTHELSDLTLATLADWFGAGNVHALAQPQNGEAAAKRARCG
jgi:DNA helicase II / ATP-dependent DNA helicase PcrA